jgi:hypothetical protein
MSRYAAKVDDNQSIIVDALRKAGYHVTLLHKVGEGVPDLIASKPWIMRFLEVKVKKGKLTPSQVKFHANWNGPAIGTVRSPEEALAFMKKEEIETMGF